jgi:predicted PurR-regulated permease PerM
MERVEISKNTIVFTVIFIVMLAVLFYSRNIVLISLIGIGIGVLVTPVLTALRKRIKLPRALSALIVLVGLILILAAVFGSL